MKNIHGQFMDDGRVLIIAEVANSHQGSMEQAEKMVKAAAEAGADAVKFQLFTAGELCVKAHSRYEHFQKLELSHEKTRTLYDLAHKNGLLFFCDAFGYESAEFLMSLPANGIKVHSADLSNVHLLNLLSDWKEAIMLSCGGASELEIHGALSILKPSEHNLILLHGFQSFPTPLEETHMKRMNHIKETFRLPVGFMDHIDAEDEMAFTLPLMAISAGAVLIEKHITLDRSLKGIDYYSSLNPDEMKTFVEKIRRAEKALGRKDVFFGSKEKEYRVKMKKQLVAASRISQGSIVKHEDLTYKRAEDNCNTLSIENIAGKKARQSINEDDVIKLSSLDLKTGILLIARMNSSRLPGKALIPIMGKPALEYLIERAKLCKSADAVILCTTERPEDDALEELALNNGITCYRGDELDVLKRMIGGCEQEGVDIAVRVTGDDIFLSPAHLDDAVRHLIETNSDYCHNKSLPSGTECEAFTVRALKTIYAFAEKPGNTEYLTYFVENESFQKSELPVAPEFQRDVSLTLDTQDDLETISFLLEKIYRPGSPYTQEDLIRCIDSHPEKFRIRHARKSYSEVKDTINCELDFSRKTNNK